MLGAMMLAIVVSTQLFYSRSLTATIVTRMFVCPLHPCDVQRCQAGGQSPLARRVDRLYGVHETHCDRGRAGAVDDGGCSWRMGCGWWCRMMANAGEWWLMLVKDGWSLCMVNLLINKLQCSSMLHSEVVTWSRSSFQQFHSHVILLSFPPREPGTAAQPPGGHARCLGAFHRRRCPVVVATGSASGTVLDGRNACSNWDQLIS